MTQGASASPAWFQGIRARSIPIPQVSVTPAKTRPAPTNAASPRNPGCTNAPERRAEHDQRPGRDPHLPLQGDRLLAADDGQPGRSQASVPPSTLTTL